MNNPVIEIHPLDGGQYRHRAWVVKQDLRFCEAVRRAHFPNPAPKPVKAVAAPIVQPEPDERRSPKPRDWWWFAELPSVDAAVCDPRPGVPAWKRIIGEVSAKHRITPIDLCSARRSRALAAARYEAMHRMRSETLMSVSEIGRRLGGRDHTTVLHGLSRYEAAMAMTREANANGAPA